MVCGGINHLRERWTKRDHRRGDPIVGIAEQLATQRAARVIAEECHNGVSKRDSLGKSPRRLTTARLKMDIDRGGDFEDTYGNELENLISPAFLRVSNRESLA
jgi:hypothetical protein